MFQSKRSAVLVLLGALVMSAQFRATATPANLKPGDIIYADSGNGVDGGFIIKVNPETGEQSVISSGNNLIRPFDVALDAQDQIIVSDTASCCSLLRIDPDSGEQVIIGDASRNVLGVPYGIAISADASVLVANAQNLVRMDPISGESRAVASGGQLVVPLAVAVDGNGNVYVLNRASQSGILRIDPTTGVQTLISRGGYLISPQAIVARNHDLYVTDVATPDGNFGVGRVIHIDLQTGAQSVVSEGGMLVGPVGIALSDNGQLVIADPYTINPDNPEAYDGAILRIDPQSGAQSLLARGRAGFVNPRGVAIVPGSPAGTDAGGPGTTGHMNPPISPKHPRWPSSFNVW